MLNFSLQNNTQIQQITDKIAMNFDRNIEQTFQLINRVRTHPRQLVDQYRSHKSQFNGKIFRNNIKTREGPQVIDDLIAQLQVRQPLSQKLKWNYGLHIMADRKAHQLGVNGLLTTEGTSQHAPLLNRAKDYAIIKGRISQVYDFGGENGEDIVQWLLMDDGLASRKRRLTLLDPTYNYIGIGSCLHKDYGVVTVIILAQDAVSLVAANQNGKLIKRQAKSQGLVKQIICEQTRQNQATTKQKLQTGYSLVNTANNQIVNNLLLRNSVQLGTSTSNRSFRNKSSLVN